MTLSILMVLVIAVFLSDTVAGRALRNALPHMKPPRLTLGRVLFVLLVLAATAAVLTWFKAESLVLGLQAAPEGLAFLATFDVVAYLDVIALVALVAATARFRLIYAALRSVMRSCLSASRRTLLRVATRNRRPRRKPSSKPGASDDPWRGVVTYA